MMWPDVLRTFLLAQAGFTLGLISLIIVAYYRVWRRADHSRGLLPLHVVAVAVAHSMLILWAVVEVYGRLGDPIGWRTPYLVVAMLVSDVALVVIMKLQVNRLRANESTNGVEVTLRHDGEIETATVVDDGEPIDEPVPLSAAYVTLRTVRSLLLSVLGLLLIVGLISVAVAFQVTRTNRMLDDGAKVRAQLLDQVNVVEDVVCGLEEPPPSPSCERNG